MAILIDLSDVDLDRGVVLGLDDSVGSRALSWNVKLDLKTKRVNNVKIFDARASSCRWNHFVDE